MILPCHQNRMERECKRIGVHQTLQEASLSQGRPSKVEQKSIRQLSR